METRQEAEWIDILRPTERDLVSLGKRFHIHPVILEELKGPSVRARVEKYATYLYLIYYFPVYDPREETSEPTEIDFVITRNAVVTAHYKHIEALAGFKSTQAQNSYQLAYALIETLLQFQERQLSHIREKVEAVGKEIFKEKEREVLQRITYLKRDISEYRIIVRLQRLILESFLRIGKEFWGKEAEVYLNDLAGDHLRIVNQLEDYREAVSDFEDTNNQLMNLKINAVMKTFTTLSFLTFPFMLLAALFSMNTRGTPIIDLPYAFWIVFGVMAAGVILLVTYFKRKGWF